MKKLKFLVAVQKIISCLFVIQMLFIVCLTLHCIMGKAWKLYDVFEVIFIESILIVGWIISSRYGNRQIIYIEIKDKTAIFYDLGGRKYTVHFEEIERIILTSERWVFIISGKDKIFAYQKIWKPYVKNSGAEHKGILPTDFAGIRIDEDYSSLM